jgi:hypothetical protein
VKIDYLRSRFKPGPDSRPLRIQIDRRVAHDSSTFEDYFLKSKICLFNFSIVFFQILLQTRFSVNYENKLWITLMNYEANHFINLNHSK